VPAAMLFAVLNKIDRMASRRRSSRAGELGVAPSCLSRPSRVARCSPRACRRPALLSTGYAPIARSVSSYDSCERSSAVTARRCPTRRRCASPPSRGRAEEGT
jgi:hypothetical protein